MGIEDRLAPQVAVYLGCDVDVAARLHDDVGLAGVGRIEVDDPADLNDLDAGAWLAVVIGPDVSDAMALASRLHHRNRRTALALSANGEPEAAALQAQVLVGPPMGRAVVLDLTAPQSAASRLRRAMARARAQIAHHVTREAARQQLENVASPSRPVASELLEGILTHLPVGVALLGPGDRVVGWSTAMEQLLAITSREALGQRLVDIAPDTYTAALVSVLLQSRERHETAQQTVEIESEPHAHHRVVASMIRDVADHVIVLVEDVTLDHRLMESEYRERAQMEADRLKRAFLGAVSHDLRTPLAAIRGFSSLLLKHIPDTVDEMFRVLPERIVANTITLNSMIDDLLAFSRLDDPDVALRLEPVDVAAFLHCLCETLSGAFGGRSVGCVVEPGVVAVADPRALDRVVTNLLTNAHRYSPSGEPIEVRASRSGAVVKVAVSDRGPGVALEDREQIFERFYRGKQAKVDAPTGTGIGLATVRELVHRMDGTVWVEDVPGGGAAFNVSLPASP